jgi:dTDP-4-amino-4,6-dideoxygalactose transaminase
VTVPYEDVERSSCYVMPVLVDPAKRAAIRHQLRENGIQTSVHYPAVHEFTAYRGSATLPRTEHAARAEITLPLFPDMDDSDQDRVVQALAEAL